MGRHLFEEALTGELGTGRTRILVTHHVGLCLPRAKYTVVLGSGTVEHAGLVKDLQRTGSLEAILKQEQLEEQEKDEGLEVPDDHVNGDALRKVMSTRSEPSAIIDDGGDHKKDKAKPKKFIEDEARETGAIKLTVYRQYLANSGGMKYWIPILVMFIGYQGMILGRVSSIQLACC